MYRMVITASITVMETVDRGSLLGQVIDGASVDHLPE